MTNQSIVNGTNDTDCDHFVEPKVSIYFRLGITALILVVAVIGNMVVLRAICKLPGRKPLIYLLIANLAAGELGQVTLQPFLLYYEQTWWQHGWPFGEFLCKVINPLHNVFLTNNTVTLGAIAVYRCWIVYSPPRRRISPFKTKILLVSFWCVGLVVALPQLAKREIIPCPVDSTVKNCCGPNWEKAILNIYILIWNIVVQYIPLVTMIVAYALVAMKIRRHIIITEKQSRKASGLFITTSCPECELQQQMELEEYPTTDNNAEPEVSSQRNGSVLEMENNLLKMMYIIVVSFVICYLPYPILFVLYHYGMLECDRYSGIFGMYTVFVLSNLPSALHPMFYGTKSKFFARAFSRLLSCKCNSYPADNTG